MSKQILSEQITSVKSLKLVESVDKQPRPGCLGTIAGVCADYKNATRNGNFYSRKLWENVFKDPLVKEALEDRVLFGELGHPSDGRLETDLGNTCMVMTSYEFDDNEGVLKGSFDILDTPSGRILKSLLDYGCVCGCSSRGEGDVTPDSEGRNVVAEDGSYYFVAFDAVAMPAVKKAKPALQESLQESNQRRQTLQESLVNEINNATTKSELDLIKKVLEATELPDLDSLFESIDIKSKNLEGTTGSSNLMEDVERLTTSVSQLTEENKRLSQEVANSKSRETKVLESRKKLYNQYSQKCKECEELSEAHSDMTLKFNQVSKKVDSLEESIDSVRSDRSKLSRKVKELEEQLESSKSKVSQLEESLERSQKLVRDKARKISELTEEVESVRDEMRQRLQESQSRETQARKSVETMKTSLKESRSQNQQTVKAYANKRAIDLGIDPKAILESVDPRMTTADVDKLLSEELSRADRYRKLTFTSDPVITSLSEGKVSIKSSQAPMNEDDIQTTSFMEQFYKIKN